MLPARNAFPSYSVLRAYIPSHLHSFASTYWRPNLKATPCWQSLITLRPLSVADAGGAAFDKLSGSTELAGIFDPSWTIHLRIGGHAQAQR